VDDSNERTAELRFTRIPNPSDVRIIARRTDVLDPLQGAPDRRLVRPPAEAERADLYHWPASVSGADRANCAVQQRTPSVRRALPVFDRWD
jgi:hypothetical protein